MAVAEHNVPLVVLIKEVDFVNQEVINNSFGQAAAVEHNVPQVVIIKGADSAKQDNKHQNIAQTHIYFYPQHSPQQTNYSTQDQTLNSSKVQLFHSIY